MSTAFAASIRTMYDGINADARNILRAWHPGDLVCWYSAGNSYIWSAADKALFPPSALVGITITASYTGPGSDILDVEAGGATPAEVADWIRRKKASGYERPTIYCSLSLVPAIRAETGAYILGHDYDLFIADWDGTTAIPYPLAAAKQYRNAGGYDISAVYDPAWPHRTATPVPAPGGKPPLSTVRVEGALVRVTGTQAVYWWNGTHLWHVTDPVMLAFLHESQFNLPITNIGQAVLDSLGPIIT
jgi:hypothetical protein